MNRLEYNEVLKTTEIPLHLWHNLNIHFGGTFYAIVEGDIPLEVANAIYEKYPDNPYGIRVNGGCNDCNPNKVYPKLYHIDSKEGLVIFITEMKNYFARKNGLPEIQNFDELMATINSAILKKVNPSISTYEWMQTDKENSEIFSQTILNEAKTPFGREFRKAIDNFDKNINPFINEEIELDEIESYLKKINISANTYDSKDINIRKKCCQIHITDLESGNKVSYYRSPGGFSYQLHYILSEGQYLTFSHYFSTVAVAEEDKGEFIVVDYWGNDQSQKFDIRYNITQGIAGETYGEKTPITPEQKKWIYNELLKAINYASTVTIANMQKKGYLK